MNTKKFLVATDVETTGLNPVNDYLLEIAVYVLEDKYPYRVIDTEGFHRVIKHDPKVVYDKASVFVKDMHGATGLWDKVANGSPIEEVDKDLLQYLSQFMDQREGRLMGNSVRLDMNFLDFHLPSTAKFLHYRLVDVSGLSWFAHQEFGVPYYEKDSSLIHTADCDIKESIKELKYVRESLSKKQ